MEGLLVAAAIAPLQARVPLEHAGWRFPDATTAVLALADARRGALWLSLRPPDPYLALVDDPGAAGGPHTPFQAQLRARAAGPLVGVQQAQLDRRLTLRFGASTGFVPAPPVRLEVELTGRHANLVLCDEDGTILGVQREVGRDVNRHRQLAPGLAYRPPPPYEKLDPRRATAAELSRALAGTTLRAAHRRIDGVGGRLAAAWRRLADVDADAPLDGPALAAAVTALERLVADPFAHLDDAPPSDPAAARHAAVLDRLRERVRAVLEDRRAVLALRVADAERAASVEDDVVALRTEADLLLSRAHAVPRGAASVTLDGFDGAARTLDLDPALDAAANATRRYERARKREARALRALERAEASAAELAGVDATIARLGELGQAELEALLPAPSTRDRRREPGLRVRDPRGFEVVIGRSSRENDLVTFKVARSDDLWLHAQGYHGAHVIVRSDGREVPFDTVRFAAALAAGHSEAGQSDNVPVDYALRRDVWRTKGMPPGAVHYARQRTVFVTPMRRSEVDDADAGSGGRLSR